MQLQIFILGHEEKMPDILSAFMEAGISGTTIVDCEGALQVLGHSQVEAPPIFGSLRQFINQGRERGKLMLTVLRDDQVHAAREAIIKIVGDISKPGAGILFTLPINNAEGLVK